VRDEERIPPRRSGGRNGVNYTAAATHSEIVETLMTKRNVRFEIPVEGTAHVKKARNKQLRARRIF
jgi:hypothetical protein